MKEIKNLKKLDIEIASESEGAETAREPVDILSLIHLLNYVRRDISRDNRLSMLLIDALIMSLSKNLDPGLSKTEH